MLYYGVEIKELFMKTVTHKVETSIKVLLFLIAAGLFINVMQLIPITAEALEEDEKQFLQNMLNQTVLKIAICKPDGSQCARVSNATGLEVDNSK